MSTRQFFTELCASEYPRTLAVLQSTPGDQLAYRPHGGCRSAQELIGHLIGHEGDLLELAQTGSFTHRNQVPFTTIEEAIEGRFGTRADHKLEVGWCVCWQFEQGAQDVRIGGRVA